MAQDTGLPDVQIDSAGLYRAMAETETDPKVSEVYRRLSAVEEAHAEFWRGQLAKIGAKAAVLRPDWRSRALAWLARRLGNRWQQGPIQQPVDAPCFVHGGSSQDG